jgi:hypothetical protein
VLRETGTVRDAGPLQEKFARDPDLVDAYRSLPATVPPFTVWYWATYPLRYLSDTILVGPRRPRGKRLRVSWAPSLDRALAMRAKKTGGTT